MLVVGQPDRWLRMTRREHHERQGSRYGRIRLHWAPLRSTPLDLAHLEARMRQSGHCIDDDALDDRAIRSMLARRIESLDVTAARSEVERFLTDPAAVAVWSRDFFRAVVQRISIRR